ncbi:hypothetical protein J32TS6_41780 [Virgibacillus pantothenticus]|uniref:Uncharacterized protein n=1 Tax=Virgibacillus pantothenticus TaxID=1473 RepID=A0A0L0QVN3_VIRPA|nr:MULTISPECIES: hypothetical protein [Virgibacillus]API92419.1 hypothetical protein BKP57_11645 [Virgibacillus sp. 6R]KNE22629.1 hypothetical protein AFK71_00265 [Virgibacillus pantothenticus]MBS7427334.1 hypothetical protein [Virgibacillus sp. 19R1-5]MBU8567015.1 hypothetical protein [Virgibacillus pantothenticus]MBU8601939.1 hypothetical protein [Virgibacillus pantothenticus]
MFSWTALTPIGLILVPLFLVYVYAYIKFSRSGESKTEHGEKIMQQAYKYSIPVFPIGWLLIEAYHRLISNVSLDIYRDCIAILVLLFFSIQGLTIIFLKNNSSLQPNSERH